MPDRSFGKSCNGPLWGGGADIVFAEGRPPRIVTAVTAHATSSQRPLQPSFGRPKSPISLIGYDDLCRFVFSNEGGLRKGPRIRQCHHWPGNPTLYGLRHIDEEGLWRLGRLERRRDMHTHRC